MLNRIITHYESLHDGDLSMIGLQPKLDPVDIWTEGWGHAMQDNSGEFIRGIENKDLAYKLSTIHTKEQADAILIQDQQAVDLLLARKISASLNPDQRESLQSFYFNCGFSTTLTSLINQGSPDLFNWWISHYLRGNGKVLPGLIARRKTEATLFTTGVLKFFN